jgi:hypothetical protein
MISKHDLVFKSSLMGSPSVVIIGQAGNKFVEYDIHTCYQITVENLNLITMEYYKREIEREWRLGFSSGSAM